jgi:hypothetical protein
MCGCEQRQNRLNELWPGLGDAVAKLAQPIKEFFMNVRILNAFAAGVGFFLADYLINRVRRDQDALKARVTADAQEAS